MSYTYYCMDDLCKWTIETNEELDALRCPVCDGLTNSKSGVLEARIAKDKGLNPLLAIVVEDMDSVPVVKYKGNTLSGKVSVSYGWDTKSDVDGKHSYNLEYGSKSEDNRLTIYKIEGSRSTAN